jgi:hypothetical protein
MNEEEKNISQPEIRPEFKMVFDFADRILSPGFEQVYPDEDSLDPSETFSGPLLDLNDELLTEQERKFGIAWIERHLGSSLETALIKTQYLSPDGKTTVEIYDKKLGDQNNPWYLSRWQNLGEQPPYILWLEETYEWQRDESGYIENNQSQA